MSDNSTVITLASKREAPVANTPETQDQIISALEDMLSEAQAGTLTSVSLTGFYSANGSMLNAFIVGDHDNISTIIGGVCLAEDLIKSHAQPIDE